MNLSKPPTPAPQDHLGLTDFLADVATRLHTAEALRPIIAAQREMDKETKEWERLSPTAIAFLLLKMWWMVGGGKVGMEVPVVAPPPG